MAARTTGGTPQWEVTFRRGTAWLVALLAFVGHCLSPRLTSGDSRWTVPVALSLLDRYDADLDEYRDLVRADQYYGVECVQQDRILQGPEIGDCRGGHIYNWYPIGVPVLAAPFVAVLRWVTHAASPWLRDLPMANWHPILGAFLRGDLVGGRALAEMLVASVFVALTTFVLYRTANLFLPSRHSAALALIFAYATPAWSTASRALYQHAPSMLMIALTVHLLAAARKSPAKASLAGLTAAIACVIRPTNVLLAVTVLAYVLHKHRDRFIACLAWASPVALAFVAFNLATYKALLPSYYKLRPPPLDSWEAGYKFLEALAGNLISPSRGLLVFVPIAAFSVMGAFRALRTSWLKPLPGYLIILFLAHWLTVSRFTGYWWGGHSYGPRLLSDMTPVLIFLLIPVVAAWRQTGWKWGASQVLFAALLVISVVIHARGAFHTAVHLWNRFPVDVDLRPERVWDWSDPQFLRGWLSSPVHSVAEPPGASPAR
ncbi:MAG: glycosyltransferase family 39 protein [Bryobacterales bacterium]|nr:glycosyltransferase family 39 protein [Bryobacterales bacterium]